MSDLGLQAADGCHQDKDMVTYNMALSILEQEAGHEDDLQSLLEDLDLMVEGGNK